MIIKWFICSISWWLFESEGVIRAFQVVQWSRIHLPMQETQEIPGSGRSPGVVNGNPLKYSCLEKFIDKEAWWAAVHGVAKSQT